MFQSGSQLTGNEGSHTVEGLKDCVITGFVGWFKKWEFSVMSFSKPNEVAEALEPKLLKRVAVYVVRTRPDLLLQ